MPDYDDGQEAYRAGYEAGSTAGFAEGVDSVYDQSAVPDAHLAGYRQGILQGTEEAHLQYLEGYRDAQEEAGTPMPSAEVLQHTYRSAYEFGEQAGFDAGYEEGFDAGFEAGYAAGLQRAPKSED